MPNVHISISEKNARVSGTPVIVCGNSDYTVKFEFDAEWDAYEEKKAEFFYYRDGKYYMDEVLFRGETVTIPILSDIDEIEIGVCAGNLHTSTGARISCVRCITDGNAVPDMPVRDVYNELMEMLLGGAYLITEDGEFIVTDTYDYIMAKE